jgi:uncharacterized protein YbaA (DUF1428 family)
MAAIHAPNRDSNTVDALRPHHSTNRAAIRRQRGEEHCARLDVSWAAFVEDVMPDKYVDAYVVPVPKSRVGEYKAFTKNISDFVKKHGALEYVDCIADDVKPGKQTSFPQAVQLGDDEIVMLSWAVYRSREDRDRAMKAMMEEPSFQNMDMPMDGKRMFMGGFKVLQAF